MWFLYDWKKYVGPLFFPRTFFFARFWCFSVYFTSKNSLDKTEKCTKQDWNICLYIFFHWYKTTNCPLILKISEMKQKIDMCTMVLSRFFIHSCYSKRRFIRIHIFWTNSKRLGLILMSRCLTWRVSTYLKWTKWKWFGFNLISHPLL